ncbi:MAG: carboxypeptidase regulatory-like domain-containing protein [Pseudomonadales bacterium]|nr:carboxypeptidase regulatory-like domain-containing protein [Pseudomonadales bacterium]
MKQGLVLIVLLFSMLNFYGCNKPVKIPETPETPAEGNTTVQGVVSDVAGQPIAGVTVFSSKESTTTDEIGGYSLSALVGEASITAQLNDYADNSRVVTTDKDQAVTLDLVLAKIDKMVIFDVNVGAFITTKGASVEFPAAAIINSDGTAYSGNVVAEVTFNQVTSSAGRDTFPGDYMGLQENGEETVLQSYGFIDVTLKDESGNALQLADGKTATLSFPVDTNIGTTPATIALWYYDTAKGIWVEDGVATYNAGSNSYIGEVSHFTTWNLDAKVESASYKGCVTDVNGAVISEALINISAPGWNKTFQNQDSAGEFGFLNAPAGLEMSITATVGNSSSASQKITLAVEENHVASECLKVDDTVENLTATLSGQLLYSSPGISQVEVIYGKYLPSQTLTLDGAGNFLSSAFTRPADNKVTVAVTIDNFRLSYDYVLDKTQLNTHIGLIEPSLTTVTGCATDSLAAAAMYSAITLDQHFPAADHINTWKSQYLTYTDNAGQFTMTLAQDNASHQLFAFNDDHKESANGPSFIANTDQITLPGCIETSAVQAVTIEVSIVNSANVTGISMNLLSSEMSVAVDGDYGDISQSINRAEPGFDSGTSGSFTTDKDAVYIIRVFGSGSNGSNDFSGVQLQVKVDGHFDQLITVPSLPVLNYSELYVLQIEVFKGEVTVTLLNVQFQDS